MRAEPVAWITGLPYGLAVLFLLISLLCYLRWIGVAAGQEKNAFQYNKLMGRGINLGNALEAPREGDWGITLEADFFAKIKQFRAIATRYEETARNFLAAVRLVACVVWLN